MKKRAGKAASSPSKQTVSAGASGILLGMALGTPVAPMPKAAAPQVAARIAQADAFYRAGRWAEAEKLVRAVLTQSPQADGFAVLGNILAARGQGDQAVSAFRSALGLDPFHVMALNNLGRLLKRLGRLAEALECLEKAVTAAPDEAAARINYADALGRAGQADQATAQIHEIIRRHPKNAKAHLLLALQCKDQRRHRDAIRAAETCLDLGGDAGEAWAVIAMAQTGLGDADAARRAYEKAVAAPKAAPALHSALLMTMQYAQSASESDILAETKAWVARHLAGIVPTSAWPGIVFAPDKRLRVALISGDFRHCSTPPLLLPLMENRAGAWHLTCYSNVAKPDAFTATFRALSDTWVDISGLSDDQAAQRIMADRIDILVDLNGHTQGGRLGVMARKPAPVQVSWLDYVSTTGLESFDAMVSDAVQLPLSDQRFYVEPIRHLAVDCLRYKPLAEAPAVGELPALRQGHVTFGAFNAAYKISPACIAAWAEILRGVPGSRLVLNAREYLSADTKSRFQALFEQAGIAAGRLDFLPGAASPAEFMEAYNKVDLAIDTFPYSGGLTTLEALHMGVPVVTFPGSRYCSRHAAAHLGAVALDDWIAPDVAGFIDLAIAKAQDIERLAELRRSLRARLAASPLGDGAGFADDFTRLFRSLWAEACSRQS